MVHKRTYEMLSSSVDVRQHMSSPGYVHKVGHVPVCFGVSVTMHVRAWHLWVYYMQLYTYL